MLNVTLSITNHFYIFESPENKKLLRKHLELKNSKMVCTGRHITCLLQRKFRFLNTQYLVLLLEKNAKLLCE